MNQIISVFMPVMNDEPMDVAHVNPAGFGKRSYELAWLTVPFHPCFDGFVRILADVSLRCVFAAEVPDAFQPS